VDRLAHRHDGGVVMMKFRELPIEQQAKIIMQHLKIDPSKFGATEQEIIEEIIEEIIVPVLRKRGRLR
jgi:hypothetical protein